MGATPYEAVVARGYTTPSRLSLQCPLLDRSFYFPSSQQPTNFLVS